MPSKTDFSSGLPDARDCVHPVPPPETPGFGENHAFWMQDEAHGMQIKCHINTCEDLHDAFDLRHARVTITRPDGRVLLSRDYGGGSTTDTAAGGPLSFRCIEPFRRWKVSFAGVMQTVTMAREATDNRVVVRFEMDVQMVAPAWINGAFTPGGLGPVKEFIGGERYEQMFHATGRLVIDDEVIPWSGYGNRTHRWGRRDLSGGPNAAPMLGHIWAVGAFPSGAGFGFQSYPALDGSIIWSEGYLVRDGALVPAEVIREPWLATYWLQGEPIEIVMRTKDGQTAEITGQILGSVAYPMIPGRTFGDQVPLFQSYARYTMNGETATNMIERSLRRSSIETGVGRPPGSLVAEMLPKG
jgi:hypothetical protein